jgi:hypothetical protein
MAHLTMPQFIKLLMGAFVVVLVVLGIYLVVSGTVIDFFKNLPGGEGEEDLGDGEEIEEVHTSTFDYYSKTYTAISSTRIERDDGRYYTLDENGWMYHDPSLEKEGYVTPTTEGSPENYDRWISLVNDAINALSEQPSGSSGMEGEDEEEEDPQAICEASGCTEQDPELECNELVGDLFNSQAKVKIYDFECNRRGVCVRKRGGEIPCDYGCTDGICDVCLSSGSPVYTIYWERTGRFNRGLCCNGYTCLDRNFFGICVEQICN